MFTEIKSYLKKDTIFYTFVILLVAIISFGLGRFSTMSGASGGPNKPLSNVVAPLNVSGEARPVVATSTVPEVTPNPTTPQVQGETAAAGVVASKSGTKYHFLWCPGAKQIKEQNRIVFETTAAARAAGYTPAANCPGLE